MVIISQSHVMRPSVVSSQLAAQGRLRYVCGLDIQNIPSHRCDEKPAKEASSRDVALMLAVLPLWPAT